LPLTQRRALPECDGIPDGKSSDERAVGQAALAIGN
jgi:hypothetical protein